MPHFATGAILWVIAISNRSDSRSYAIVWECGEKGRLLGVDHGIQFAGLDSQ